MSSRRKIFRRRGPAIARLKRERKAENAAHCEVCGWAPPTGLKRLGVRDAETMLHGHHVVPIACGGPDRKSNIVLLCPTHHAVAHRLGSMQEDESTGRKVWTGAATPDALLSELFLLEQNNKRWDKYVDAGRNATDLRHLHADTVAELRRSTFRCVS